MNNARFAGNRVTALFGIRHPLIQAGMVWCSGWELAAAVSNAGGLGIIGSGSMQPEILREHIRKCKAATEQPFGVNVPMLYSHAEANLQVMREENVKIVFTSAGNPAKFTPQLVQEGFTVVHVVSSVKFAKKAEAAGCHAVVAEGFEAGGHNGREELTTFVLIPQVKKEIKIPLIAAGGIATGEAMLAAMVLGAEGVQVGTRFVASVESSAHDAFKNAVITAAEDSTMLRLKQLTPVRLLKNKFSAAVEEAEKRGASAEELKELLGRGRAKLGMFDGNLDEGELEIGQVAGLLDNLLPAEEIVRQMLEEFDNACNRVKNL